MRAVQNHLIKLFEPWADDSLRVVSRPLSKLLQSCWALLKELLELWEELRPVAQLQAALSAPFASKSCSMSNSLIKTKQSWMRAAARPLSASWEAEKSLESCIYLSKAFGLEQKLLSSQHHFEQQAEELIRRASPSGSAAASCFSCFECRASLCSTAASSFDCSSKLL